MRYDVHRSSYYEAVLRVTVQDVIMQEVIMHKM